MKLIRLFVVCSAAAMLPAAMAQKWEFGMGAGGGFYTPQHVNLGSDSASAKFKTKVRGVFHFGPGQLAGFAGGK